ncbi:MAG: hypothetical protein HN392_00905 [Anaerolineae bacterium]|jgi:cbb3-type cytochrome oxidase subunit 3|nr:hypothetical protein [Anaerolineae bacterium]MBT7074099.1 hypothetical protein [Anaerolineae bacterium]MBT7783654.1 hypothetical protein [Anaerolineae bacterium]
MNNYLIIGLVIFIILLAVIAFVKNKNKKTEPDYRAFFILGITWLPLGIATDNSAFTSLGIVFLVLGLVNRDKWKEQVKWSELSEEKKKAKLILIVVLTILLILGIAAYILAGKN